MWAQAVPWTCMLKYIELSVAGDRGTLRVGGGLIQLCHPGVLGAEGSPREVINTSDIRDPERENLHPLLTTTTLLPFRVTVVWCWWGRSLGC